MGAPVDRGDLGGHADGCRVWGAGPTPEEVFIGAPYTSIAMVNGEGKLMVLPPFTQP